MNDIEVFVSILERPGTQVWKFKSVKSNTKIFG